MNFRGSAWDKHLARRQCPQGQAEHMQEHFNLWAPPKSLVNHWQNVDGSIWPFLSSFLCTKPRSGAGPLSRSQVALQPLLESSVGLTVVICDGHVHLFEVLASVSRIGSVQRS